MPAALAYGSLLDCLGPGYDAAAKELEVYLEERPPDSYRLEVEVEGVIRFADARGWRRFHLVGYSGGGAAALATAALHPDRLLTLALLEPAWAGHWDLAPEETRLLDELERIRDESLPSAELMARFVRMQLAPGVKAPEPPPGPPPDWMARRPAGVEAIGAAFRDGEIDRDALRGFDRPVYFVRGGLSADFWRAMEQRLAATFPRFRSQVFEGRHHFDPPHRIEPERLARELRAHWASAPD